MAGQLILPNSVQRRMKAERDAREVEASKVFGWALPREEPALLLRQDLLSIWMAPGHIPAETILWIGTEVARKVYGRYAIAPRKPVGPRDAARLFGFGFAAMAGNIPELLTELGYDPVRAALRAFVLAKPWKRVRREARDRAVVARFAAKLRQYHVASHYEVGKAYRRYEAWVQHNWPKDYLRRSDDIRFKIYHLLDSKFGAPRRATPEVSRAMLIEAARRKGYEYEWSRPDDADDIVAGWICNQQAGIRTAGVYIGDDGLWYPDTRGMVDAAVAQGQFTKRDEPPISDVVNSNTAAIKPMLPSAPSPAEVLEDADRRAALLKFEKLIATIELDDLDRRNLALVPEVGSRRERARRLGVDEAALRKREKRLRGRLSAAADPALRRFLSQFHAA